MDKFPNYVLILLFNLTKEVLSLTLEQMPERANAARFQQSEPEADSMKTNSNRMAASIGDGRRETKFSQTKPKTFTQVVDFWDFLGVTR